MKLTDLVEQNLGYTPERIDELIQEGTQEWNEVITDIQNTPPDQMAWFF